MHIERLAVSGFKSFLDRQEVTFRQGVSVVHGENASGKTNLIRAIELVTILLGDMRSDWKTTGEPLSRYGRLFHIQGDQRARLEVDVALSERDLVDAGLPQLVPQARRVSVEWTLSYESGADIKVVVEKYSLADGKNIVTPGGPVHDPAALLAQKLFRERPLIHLLVTRRFVDERRLGPEAALPDDRLLSRVQFRLFKCYLTPDLEPLYHKFASLLRAPPLSIGTVKPSMDPDTEKLGVYVETKLGKFELPDLASGTKQIILLLAKLVLEGGPIVAIQEPEISLSFRSQQALFAAFERLCADPEGPVQQILLESHSEGFELARTAPEARFINVEHDGVKTLLSVLPGTERARQFPPADEGRQPDMRLTRSGLVKLPDGVRESLRLKPGDPVFFLPGAPGGWELVNEDEFFRRTTPKEAS